MHFCNISEAWNNDNYITEHYTNVGKKRFEKFSPITRKNNLRSKMSRNRYHNNNLSCQQIITHATSCHRCSAALRNKMYGNFYGNIRNTLENYREPITLVLITLFIVLIINIILKMD